MQPVRNNVLVKPFPGDEISLGGIYVPDSVRELSNKVTIVAVGNGTKDTPMKLKPGQVAYKMKSDGSESWCNEFIINGVVHYLLNQDAILATG